MALIQLLPVIDSLTGTTSTPATFYAERRKAKRAVISVAGPAVTIPQKLKWTWDGTAWDIAPQLGVLPVDEYWWTALYADRIHLERNVSGVGLDALSAIDFGALQDVVPDTASVDTAVAQWQAAIQTMQLLVAAGAANNAASADALASVLAQIAAVQLAQDQVYAGLSAIAASQSLAEDAAAAAAQSALAAQIDVDAEIQALPDLARTGDYADLLNKPTLATFGGVDVATVAAMIAAAIQPPAPDGNTAGTVIDGNTSGIALDGNQ